MSEVFWVVSWTLGLYAVGLVAASIVHELGHLICARISSIPIGLMTIGSGPVLLRGRIGELRLEFRLLAIGGLVVPSALPDPERRGAMALYILGGVLGNIAAIGIIILLHVTGAVPSPHTEAGVSLAPLQAGALVFAQIIIMIVTLIPYSAPVGQRVFASDGLHLRRVLSGRFPYALLLAPYCGGATRLPLTSPASQRIAGQFAQRDRWTNEAVRHGLYAAFRRELEEGGLPVEEELLVLDTLVTYGLFFADPSLRPDLDQWSGRAIRLAPQLKTLVGSRGAVLIEIGRYQEGKALLESVAFAADITPEDTLISRTFLARAEHALGNRAAAHELMDEVLAVARGRVGPATLALVERTAAEIGDVPEKRGMLASA